MSRISVKAAIAFVLILTYPAASFARHAVTTAVKRTPIASDPVHGKCLLGSSGSIAPPVRVPPSVCWAPEDMTDGPGV